MGFSENNFSQGLEQEKDETAVELWGMIKGLRFGKDKKELQPGESVVGYPKRGGVLLYYNTSFDTLTIERRGKGFEIRVRQDFGETEFFLTDGKIVEVSEPSAGLDQYDDPYSDYPVSEDSLVNVLNQIESWTDPI